MQHNHWHTFPSGEPLRAGVALAVSVALHAALLAYLSLAAVPLREHAAAPAAILHVALVAPAPRAAEPPPLSPPAPLHADATPNATASSPHERRSDARRTLTRPGGLVTLATDVPMSRLGPGVTQRIGQFPVEIDHPVRLPRRFAIPYPPSALASREQGTVLLWLIVNTEGKPEEIHVVEGSGDLLQAVIESVTSATFGAATSEGHAIRYHIALAVDFRLGGTEASATASAAR
ncbi:MAG TPA: energy transducer TonB [Casimicrobiaceae bacterium]